MTGNSPDADDDVKEYADLLDDEEKQSLEPAENPGPMTGPLLTDRLAAAPLLAGLVAFVILSRMGAGLGSVFVSAVVVMLLTAMAATLVVVR